VTSREPEWTEQDVAEILALAVYRSSLCPGGCGYPIAETTTHEDDGPEYSARSTTCRACAALLEAQRAKAGSTQDNPDAPARLWRISMRKAVG